MPEPLSVIALLLFGFIAGWVIRSAVPRAGESSAPDAAPSADRDVAPEETAPAVAPAPEEPTQIAAAPVPAPIEPVPDPEPTFAEPATPAQLEPEPELEPAAVAPRSPEADQAIEATLTAYDEVLDDWLDDRGELGEPGRASLAAFDGALAELERQEGVDEVLAPLRIAGDLIHERRERPMDSATDAALRGLEQRFRA
ncbi:MAG TPA: hypothetical protein VF533_02415 [Solirubrobacteraceae bacterium]|jgi:hypothetical protein